MAGTTGLERECRDEAYDSPWNLEGHRNEIRVFERLSIGDPIEATIQTFQPISVSKRIKRSWVYSQLYCTLCLEHAAVRSKNAQSVLCGRRWN
jgi:hypothetical protein